MAFSGAAGAASLFQVNILGHNAGQPVDGYGQVFQVGAGGMSLDGAVLYVFTGWRGQVSLGYEDTFTLIHAEGGIEGEFSNVADGERIKSSSGEHSFIVNYTEHEVIVSKFLPAPEPASAALVMAGAGFLLGSRRQRK